MTRLLRLAVLSIGLIATEPLLAQTAAPATPSGELDGFTRQYNLTFALDECGDPLLGEQYRRALADKLNACPFDPKARSRALAGAEKDAAIEKQVIAEYLKEHHSLPERLDGMKQSCKEMLKLDQINDLRTRLQSYSDGKIGPDAALPDPCSNFGPQKP